jgi:hypothetical protein
VLLLRLYNDIVIVDSQRGPRAAAVVTDTDNDIPRIGKPRRADHIEYTTTYRTKEQELYRRGLQNTDRTASRLL